MVGPTALLIAGWLSATHAADAPSAVRAWVVRGDGPADAVADTQRVLVSWDGGPADVRLRLPGTDSERVLAHDATSPFRTPPLPRGATLRVVRDGTSLGESTPARVWTPADVASWSGPGLRGAWVTAIAPTDHGVWVGTRDGGMGWWDGVGWSQLDRRTLGSDSVVDLVIVDRTRWVATPDALVRVSADGVVTRWPVGDALPGHRLLQLTADGHGGVWARTDLAIADVRDTVLEVRREACHALVPTPDGPVAACGGGARRLEDDVRVDLGGDAVIDWIPRADGAWIGTADQVYAWVKGEAVDRWSPPSGRVLAVARVGDGLAIAAGTDGLFLRDDDGWSAVGPASGLPGQAAVAVAPGASYGRAWVGTDRGLALANVGGTATPLPLAPLAAGIAVHAIEVRGSSAALATGDGLRWVGGGAPPGWQDLVAAVGAPATTLTRVDKRWWAGAGDTLFSLDEDGALARWPLHDGLVALAHDRTRLLVATTHGVRWWVPGASMLSPIDPYDDVRDAALGPDGSAWVLTARGLHHTSAQEWWAFEDAHALHVAGAGAIVATDRGVAWCATGRPDPTWTHTHTGPVVDVHAAGGRTWAIGADGRLWSDLGGDPTAIDLGAAIGPRAVRADRDGAWVGSEAGVFRVTR